MEKIYSAESVGLEFKSVGVIRRFYWERGQEREAISLTPGFSPVISKPELTANRF